MGRWTPLLVIAVASSVSAHDFWIEPSNFHPRVSERVSVSLRVGQQFQGDPVPRVPELIDRFTIGDTPVPGLTGRDPAGFASIADAGAHWIAYQSRANSVALDPQKFEQYLQEEGLPSVKPGREHFYRCAKSLLDTPGPTRVISRPLGLTLELIPRAIKNDLPVTLLFHGKPIANILVVAINKEEPEKKISGRTDKKGRVALRLTRPGVWLVKAVHMEPAPPGTDAEWESWWASITFDLTAGTPPPK